MVVPESPSAAEIFETQIEQSTGCDGANAQFRLWLPLAIHPKRVIALIWGGNQCSLGAVNDPGWRALAQSSDCALLSCYFAPQTSDNPWDFADGGSGQLLLDALKELSQKTGESQLSDAQLLLIGDSQGGQYAFHFAGWNPHRTVGFISIKGGRHQSTSVPSAAKVPGLFFLGQMDLPFRIKNVIETFDQGRSLGAPWCLAVDPGATHEPESCSALVRDFVEELLRNPRSNGFPAAAPAGLENTVSHFDLSYLPSWFPSAAFGDDWKSFEAGGLIPVEGNPSFKSETPAKIAEANPPSINAGTINSGDKSSLLHLGIEYAPAGLDRNVTILNRPYLSDLKVEGSLALGTSISTRLDTIGLPLGFFRGIVPLRFDVDGQRGLGAINVPVTALIVGDIRAIPSLIDLGSVQLQKRSLVKLKIESKTKTPIEFVSCETPSSVSFVSALPSANSLELTFAFDFDSGSLNTSASGSILLTLKTTKEWLLRVPFVASVEQ